MKRLFIAVPLPDRVVERLSGIKTSVNGARWLNREQMHITLRFIGDVEEHRVRQIGEILSEISFSPFSIRLQGTGVFPRGTSPPRILWAGVDEKDNLHRLKNRIDSLLVAADLQKEKRKFHPHVTLARMKGSDIRSVSEYLAEHSRLRTEKFEVNKFILFSSVLNRGGAVYTPEYIFDLDDSYENRSLN